MGDGRRRQQTAGLSDAAAVGGGRQRHECGSGVWWQCGTRVDRGVVERVGERWVGGEGRGGGAAFFG
jgi:hypothetical protein